MKRVRGAVECNTKTARKIASADGVTLHKTKSRKFFFAEGDEVRLISDTDARDWLVEHCGADEAEAAFVDEDLRRITVDLPVELVERIDAARDDEKRSRRAVILAALQEQFGR